MSSHSLNARLALCADYFAPSRNVFVSRQGKQIRTLTENAAPSNIAAMKAAPEQRLLVLPGALLVAFFLAASWAHSAPSPQAGTLAATPPMGWNSWDAFGRGVNEEKIVTTARWMSEHLKSFGWQYVVADEGWYIAEAGTAIDADVPHFQLDANGRYVPVPSRFPSAGKEMTFRPLADRVHGLGLKFGIHIIRGIPREAVDKNLPIAGSSFHAPDAADTTDKCPWNAYNYGLKPDSPASQAYYDSIAKQYADWGVDLVKIDCISDHPYKGDEIRMFHDAVAKSDRPMVISLSPGPTPPAKREEVARYSQMWRVSDDVWDVWSSGGKDFPQGPKDQFARMEKWAGAAGPGHWPDADMLPLGSLRPTPGWGEPRDSRLTHDEQRTMLSFWSIVRSPLIMGGNLLEADAWTVSLLTNAEVLAVDQHSKDNRPVLTTNDLVIWQARPEQGAGIYLAVFNSGDSPQKVQGQWKDLGLTASTYKLRDLWEHKELGAEASLNVDLAPHASILYRLIP